MTKRTPRPEPLDPNRDNLAIDRTQFGKELDERIRIGEEFLTVNINSFDEVDKLRREAAQWSDYNSELLKSSFEGETNSYRAAYDGAYVTRMFGIGDSLQDKVLAVHQDVNIRLNNLRSLKGKIKLLKLSATGRPQTTATDTKLEFDLKKVFVVHGHDTALKEQVARALDKLKLKPIVLHEQANGGRTIIEKFESHANEVGFAIVLLTGDDEGRSKMKGGDLTPRARQNVIFELGFFFGKLTRRRVVVLYKDAEKPSDIDGLVYVYADEGGSWIFQVAKELREAGYQIDMNLL